MDSIRYPANSAPGASSPRTLTSPAPSHAPPPRCREESRGRTEAGGAVAGSNVGWGRAETAAVRRSAGFVREHGEVGERLPEPVVLVGGEGAERRAAVG